ncbi:MAG TPA: hypothetical protein VM115_13645 [Vicinamibacterales bacterium]|nr:hypothetical protein [Vicinamibacterales bacterium]
MSRAQRVMAAILMCVAGGFLPLQVSAQFRKGLGQGLFEVTLTRTRPPSVYLMKTGIGVQVTSNVTRPGVTDQLASAIESDLVSNDPRLTLQKGKPQIAVTCNVTRLDTNQKVEMKTVSAYKVIRTDRVYNAKTKKYDEKPVYGTVSEIKNSVLVTGDISLTYQARDSATGAVIDSATFSPTYRKDFPNGAGAPSTADVEQLLVTDAVREVVRRLAPTKEPVRIQLGRPSDAIDDLNKLGQAGLWSRMLEQLEKMTPLKDRGKEAYRQYNIGVAHEAIGYESADVGVALKHLEQAAAQYGRAIEMKPDEKYFREPQTRIATAIASYSTLEDRIAAYDRVKSQPVARASAPASRASIPAPPASTSAPRATAAKGTFGNAEVIDLLKSGLDEDNMLAAIRDARTVSFDLSPDGLKQLLSNKVPNRIIAAMRAKSAR